MKAIIFILGVMFITNSNAQKFDCPSKMTEYQELFKAKKMLNHSILGLLSAKIVQKKTKRFIRMELKLFNTKLTMQLLQKKKKS